MRAMPRALFAILLVGLLVLAGCVQEPPPASPFNGQEFDNGMYAPLFTLESMDGELWSLEEQRGKTVVMAFIYTRCYETCPVISAAINHAKTKLTSEENLSVVWVSITIDPYHDSPSVLQNWTSDRGYDWVHLTGNRQCGEPSFGCLRGRPHPLRGQFKSGLRLLASATNVRHRFQRLSSGGME